MPSLPAMRVCCAAMGLRPVCSDSSAAVPQSAPSDASCALCVCAAEVCARREEGAVKGSLCGTGAVYVPRSGVAADGIFCVCFALWKVLCVVSPVTIRCACAAVMHISLSSLLINDVAVLLSVLSSLSFFVCCVSLVVRISDTSALSVLFRLFFGSLPWYADISPVVFTSCAIVLSLS